MWVKDAREDALAIAGNGEGSPWLLVNSRLISAQNNISSCVGRLVSVLPTNAYDEKLFAEERPDPWHCQVKPEEKKRIARCVDHGVGQKAGMTPDDVKPAMTQCLA